jgi:membrane protease YdiL (CAAX protease family)
MTTQSLNKKRTIRNLIIFTVIVFGMGWLGWTLYVLGDRTTDAQGLGALLFIISPLVACVLLRLFGGDGWGDMGLAPRLKAHWRWYFFSLLIYPITIALTLVIGALTGGITFPAAGGWGLFLQLAAAAFVGNFFKNILEEFGWRAYLAPKIFTIDLPDMAAHLISGAIWGLWHLPYYLGLIDQAMLRGYTPQSMVTFLPLVIIGIAVAAIAHNELRLITSSVWPAVVLHTISNTLTLVLLVDGFVALNASTEFLFSPGWHSLLSIALNLAIGLGLYRYRTRQGV